MGRRRQGIGRPQKRGQSRMTARERTALEEQEDLRQRANGDHIRKALAGRMAPTRGQIVDKLNRRRKEREEKSCKQ